MSVKQVQNFYKDTVKTAWTAGAGNFYVSTAKPTVAPGFLVVSPGDASKREIIYYTATGTDGGGDYITVSSAAHRGLGGTTAQAHAVSEKIRMNLTAQNWQEVIDELATKYGPGITVPTPTLPGDTVNKDYADSLAIAGSPNASTSVKGISKLTATPMKSLGTATITIATPGVITLASHGLIAGDTIELTTSGALPTGLSASTTYFVISTGLTANDFQVSLSNGGAAINTSGSQSGTHTLYRTTPYAVGDQDGRMLTQAQNDAADGESGTPSSTNKFETKNDTSNASTKTATTISFTSGTKTIADSGNGFVTAGFLAGTSITITGSASNNGTFTIVSVAAGAIVVEESLVTESAGATVVMTSVSSGKLARRLSTGAITVPTPVNSTDTVNKAYADGAQTLVMGEAFTGATTPQPAKLISDIAQPFGAESMVMGTTSITRRALKIVPRQGCTVSSVIFPYVFQNAADNAITLTVTIETDSAGSPSGTPITNGTSSSNALNTNTISTVKYGNFTFSTPPTLVAGTTYWVVIKLSSTTASDVIIWGTSTSYASFSGKVYTGSWASGNLPALEIITATGDSKSLWRSDGNGTFQTNGFDCFVTNTGSAGDSATTLRNRIIGGFSGLDTGSEYYLSNTVGTITRAKNEGGFVGTAISATELFIPETRNKDSFSIASAVGTFTESGSFSNTSPLVFLEDGFLTMAVKPGTSGGNTIATSIYTARSYANNTSPTSLATVKTIIGGTTGVIIQSMPITIPVKKGERITIAAASSGTGMTVGNLWFTPL